MFIKENYQKYLNILNEELITAFGCTDPISVAYSAALACSYLDTFPTKINIKASGNLIKNAKAVIIPNTNGLKGMQASLIAGVVGGDSKLGLEVLANINKEDIIKINKLMNTGFASIEQLKTTSTLHSITTAYDDKNIVEVEIKDFHDNVVRITKNNKDILVKDNNIESKHEDRSILNVEQILSFVEYVKKEDYYDLLDIQINNNITIANEGLNNDYGINVGKTLLKYANNSIETKIKAYTAAGSDARMGGCTLPVGTNSGSGNNGMTCSIPIVVYAKEKGISKDKMYKALLLSNLITIHIKNGIGRLSCYCGSVVGACGAACGIGYLENYTNKQIEMIIINILGNLSGMICDGAKESCPSKIATCLDGTFQALYLAKDNKVYSNGCGIIESDVEKTIKNVGILGRVGMKETDICVLDIMTKINN